MFEKIFQIFVVTVLTLIAIGVNVLIVYAVIIERAWIGMVFLPMGLALFIFPILMGMTFWD